MKGVLARVVKQRVQVYSRGGAIAPAMAVLQQEQRERRSVYAVLIPGRMRLYKALERFVKVFRNFCQDAYGYLHRVSLSSPALLAGGRIILRRRAGICQ